jgi:predicted NUDIX family NTP pyrophosphohydrolase
MKKSFGILMYKMVSGRPEFLLAHPGGPFFKNKDLGAWSIPKGEGNENEEPLVAAIREFEEETGVRPEGSFIYLEPVTQKGGKQVHCWAVEGNFDVEMLKSNVFPMVWPPKSGKTVMVPEVDRAEWFDYDSARTKINERQAGFLEQIRKIIDSNR